MINSNRELLTQRLETGKRSPRNLVQITLSTEKDRQEIYRVRHDVYAQELAQHNTNDAGLLRDVLDEWNIYLVAMSGKELAGFVSLTPPASPSYSIDKYFSRQSLPFRCDDRLYEVRILTVAKPHRKREIASLLMYAAYRWVEAHQGSHIVAIGRREILQMYLRVGLRATGLSVSSGAVTYDLLHGETSAISLRLEQFPALLARIEEKTDWRLSFPFRKPADCFHGGAFFSAIGEGFDDLNKYKNVINADVLDAWFPPAPGVLATLKDDFSWILRTSPPTSCAGLVGQIAESRGVLAEHIMPGAGSSDLIFRAFREWLTKDSHTLILDPTYGEYAHILERVIGCTTDRLTLDPAHHYRVDLHRLARALEDNYDLVVIVNPNSPTGQHIPRAALENVLRHSPSQTRFWIDETYVDYVAPAESLESFAAQTENVVVCKSMSKVYALSGARVAYLCAAPHQLEALRAITPPWAVSLVAQIAGVRALQDPDYYAARYRETAGLRDALSAQLSELGWKPIPATANFLLCNLPPSAPSAAELLRRCQSRGLFLRNAQSMGQRFGERTVRLAVKDADTNLKMIRILSEILDKASGH